MSVGRRETILITLVASLFWGIWWVPIRQMEAAGLHGVWPSLAMCLFAMPALAYFARGLTRMSKRAMLAAGLVGLAVMLYGASLAFTDVVRAVLLFYLAPAWSVAIECLFFGRRWTWWSSLALGLSFLGVATIFRFEIALDGFNAGDMAALISGMVWSVAAALLFTEENARPATLAFGACLGGALASGLIILIGGAASGEVPTWDALGALPWAVGSGLLYTAPILLVTLWGAQRLPPATMSFLLTAEIISGVVTSAIFLDERFGAMEAVGAVLVAAGALTETLTTRQPEPA